MRGGASTDEATGHGPGFSVIVPSRDRPRALERCLHALARLDYEPSEFEVVVADNRGHTPLGGVLERFGDRLSIRLVSERRRGPAAARNAAAAAAAGRFLAFTDDDCEPAADWLAALERRLADAPGSVVGGSIANALDRSASSRASHVVMDALYRYYNADPTSARFLASNNLALSARLFRELGGFDTRFSRAGGEDREFCDRCEAHGVPMIYAPEAVIAHAHELTLLSLWRQHLNYGRGTTVFHAMRRAGGRGRVRLEPGLHAALVRTALASRPARGRLRLLAAVLLTQVAYGVGFTRELIRRRASEAP